MFWVICNKGTRPDHLGLIPSFFDEEDERTGPEQVNANYCDVWHPTSGLSLGATADLRVPTTLKLYYPGDPPMEPLAWARFRDQVIVIYEYGFTAIFDPDLTFEIARLD